MKLRRALLSSKAPGESLKGIDHWSRAHYLPEGQFGCNRAVWVCKVCCKHKVLLSATQWVKCTAHLLWDTLYFKGAKYHSCSKKIVHNLLLIHQSTLKASPLSFCFIFQEGNILAQSLYSFPSCPFANFYQNRRSWKVDVEEAVTMVMRGWTTGNSQAFNTYIYSCTWQPKILRITQYIFTEHPSYWYSEGQARCIRQV